MISRQLWLLHIQYQSFQIFSFRMIDIYRMVTGLSQLVQDTHTTPCLSSSCKDRIAKIILRYHLRTGESKQNPSRTNLLESFCVEFGISTQGITKCVTVLGKSRWIKNNQIILFSHTVKILECIFGKCLMTHIARKIQLHVFISKVDCFRRTVYRMYQSGTSAHCIERKSTCIAEHIKYISPCCITFQ